MSVCMCVWEQKTEIKWLCKLYLTCISLPQSDCEYVQMVAGDRSIRWAQSHARQHASLYGECIETFDTFLPSLIS